MLPSAAPVAHEKRRHARLKLIPPVRARLEVGPTPCIESVMVVDLSETGCAVLVPGRNPIAPTPRVTGDLELTLTSSSTDRVRLAVRSAYVVPYVLGGWRIGFEFLGIDSALPGTRERLQAFLRKTGTFYRAREAAWRDERS
ncbi:MAG TPA: PilZ domain-containing protein [Planctomycetota bacterium]|nr:PilZ domain-containing protein [Planctomycetota bacterium]